MPPSGDSLPSRLQGVTSAIERRIVGVRSHQWAILILIAHFILGVLYSVIVPIWEAYDEPGHYAYVRYVAVKRALPPPGETLIGLPWDERYQPPLYYLLGALGTFWVHTSEELDLTWNPHSHGGRQGGVNFFVHSDEEAFPYRGTVLAVHVTRLVSVLLSTVAVVVTYLVGRSIFPGRREIAIGAMALNAFWPQFLFAGSVVTNDIPAVLFSSLVVLFLVRILKQGGGLYDFLGLGLSLGAGLITKRNVLALLPLVILGLVIAAMGARRSWRSSRFWLGFLSAVIVASLVSGWWFVRNMSTHGQPLGLYYTYLLSFLSLLRQPLSEMKSLHWEIFPQLVRYCSITIWASFGWGNVGVADWVHQLFRVTCLAGSLGLALFVAGSDRTTSLVLLVLLLDIFFAFAIPLYPFLVEGSMHLPGRYVLPGVSALSLLLFTGLWQLVPQRLNKAATAAFSLGIFLLALIIPFRFIAPAYARPPILSPADIEQIQYPLRVKFGDKMELLGYDLDVHNIKAGKLVPITLYWRSLAKMKRNYTVAVQVLGPDQQPYGGWDNYPGRGNYATSLWKVGDIVRETYHVGISRDFPAPSYGQILVALYLYPTEEHLPILDSEGHPISDSLIFGRFRVASRFPSEPSIENPVYFNAGNVAALIGYKIDPPGLPGTPMRVTLYWKALQDTNRDYTVFLHLQDEQGTPWGQHDGQHRNGTYPTSLWEEGEIIEDEHLIPLPGDAPPGQYRLVLGLYLSETMERLPIFDEDGIRMLHDQIVIERVWSK